MPSSAGQERGVVGSGGGVASRGEHVAEGDDYLGVAGVAGGRGGARGRTRRAPPAARPTAALNVCGPMGTTGAATADAIRTARSTGRSGRPVGTRSGGLASSTAKLAASAKLLVACPLGKAAPM